MLHALKGTIWLGLTISLVSILAFVPARIVFGNQVYYALIFAGLPFWLAGAVVLGLHDWLSAPQKVLSTAMGGMLIRVVAAYFGAQLAFWCAPLLYWPHFLLLLVLFYCVSLAFEVAWIVRNR